MVKYAGRMPGLPEIVGPLIRWLQGTSVLPRWLRVWPARFFATNVELPAYVRCFEAKVAGVRLSIAARPRVSLVGLAYYQGLDEFEPETAGVVAALARCVRVFVDVGANAGIFSLLVAHIQPKARIVSIEPQPLAAMSMARSVSFAGTRNIELHTIALGSSEGYLPLYTTASDTLTSLDARRVADPSILMVAVTTLDALAANRNIVEVDLIKIDVEGWELEVLRGATKVIERDRPVVIFEVLADAPISGLEVFFRAHRYDTFSLSGRGVSPAALSAAPTSATERNFVAIPAEKVDTVREILRDRWSR